MPFLDETRAWRGLEKSKNDLGQFSGVLFYLQLAKMILKSQEVMELNLGKQNSQN